ncbi:hypothetical protein MSSIT_3878 [Methanosarcina siciliae T4/M]|uniref:Uncharacterized protein n=2 Tax=Methanosarcina siciliae TaxID=38027 RepID=A0A0E3LBW7_9EURY|nr:hypothetical protein MSSIT_3878 [Methanosarcina siciliae T4/M]AKB34491.1 hypothetical protein MSSIH_3801 [Methanosarcina siciliae HI350]
MGKTLKIQKIIKTSTKKDCNWRNKKAKEQKNTHDRSFEVGSLSAFSPLLFLPGPENPQGPKSYMGAYASFPFRLLNL